MHKLLVDYTTETAVAQLEIYNINIIFLQWGDMLYLWTPVTKNYKQQLGMLVYCKTEIVIIIKSNLFSPW
jgi:hypothetical protein